MAVSHLFHQGTASLKRYFMMRLPDYGTRAWKTTKQTKSTSLKKTPARAGNHPK